MGFNTSSPEYSANSVCSAKYSGFNVSAPGANTGITGGIVFSPSASACRVTVALTTASVLNVTCTDGVTPHKWGLQGSVALAAGDLYALTFAVRGTTTGLEGGTTLTYDFEVETDGVIECLLVEEVTGGVV